MNLIDLILGILDKILSICVNSKQLQNENDNPSTVNVYQGCNVDNRSIDFSTHYHIEPKDDASTHTVSSFDNYDFSAVVFLSAALLVLYEYLYWIKLTMSILWLCTLLIFIYFDRKNLRKGLDYAKIRLSYWPSYLICLISLILAEEGIDINLMAKGSLWSMAQVIFIVLGLLFFLLALFNPFSNLGKAFCQGIPFTYKGNIISKCILCSLLSLGLTSGMIYNIVYYFAHLTTHTASSFL